MTDFGKLVFIEAGWIHHTVPETAERWDKELALRVAGKQKQCNTNNTASPWNINAFTFLCKLNFIMNAQSKTWYTKHDFSNFISNNPEIVLPL